MKLRTDYLVALSFALLISSSFLSLFIDDVIYVQISSVLILLLILLKNISKNIISRTNKYLFQYLLLVLLLYTIMMSSFLWSVYQIEYGLLLFEFTIMATLPFIAFMVINSRVIEYFKLFVIAVAFGASIYVISSYFLAGAINIYGVVEDYLIISHIIGAGLVISYSSILLQHKKSYLMLFCTLLLFLSLFLSIGRGALISSLLIILFISALRYVKIKNIFEFKVNKGLIFSVISLTVLITIGIILLSNNEYAFNRMSKIFTSGGTSLSGREILWANSIEAIKDKPLLGYGFGTSGITSIGREDYYPHNLFLQIWSEGGILALFTIIVLILFPFYKSIKNLTYNNQHLPLLALYLFLILEYSKSSNFYDARMFFVVGLMLLYKIKIQQNI